jgi:hypothetical protein
MGISPIIGTGRLTHLNQNSLDRNKIYGILIIRNVQKNKSLGYSI